MQKVVPLIPPTVGCGGVLYHPHCFRLLGQGPTSGRAEVEDKEEIRPWII